MASRLPLLAYAYDASASQVTVRVYDPNSGRNDGTYIRFDPRAPAKPTTFAHNLNIARPVRGFFRTAYAPATPPGSDPLPHRPQQPVHPAPRHATDEFTELKEGYSGHPVEVQANSR